MAEQKSVTVLGLGAMGTELARALVAAGYRTVVWNRTDGRAQALADSGAIVADDVATAIAAAPVLVTVLFDDASVREVLAPHAALLAGHTVVNVTTTSPNQSRAFAEWVVDQGADYLDGGIMAVPSMIGGPGSSILFSGSESGFNANRDLLELWGEARYLGSDPGLAALYDFALLSGMYIMFAGYMHGAAMVAKAGVKAEEFAGMAAPWLAAMTGELGAYGRVIDGGDYTVPGQQSLAFSDLTKMVGAARDEGVSPEALQMVQNLIERQRDQGFSDHGFARIFESLANRS
ncbi:NAD(P)-dependent oxidoreductase [Nocardia spumae]|uniref:NAD(P)-dependent oxidoreductase n=1 Tax=Nocardia spumae TaxID=2887190 RepID=UPI001D1440CE|nr:NAD(P)-binding domain-containing protein [Nocardia spumae]